MSDSTKDAAKRKRPRKAKRKPRKGGSETPKQRAQRLFNELNKLAYEIAQSKGYVGRTPKATQEVHVPLTLRIDGSRPAQAGAEAWLGALHERIDLVLTADEAFVFGAVRCFLCQSSCCEHAMPPDGTHTFAGYAANGKPEWISLTNLLIGLGDGRVESLYSSRPEVIALVQRGEDLSEQLLPAFGRDDHHYKLIGQVVAGRVPDHVMSRSTRGDPRVLTIQYVESRCPGQCPELRLNLMGLSYDEVIEAAAEGGARAPAEALRRTLFATRQRLKTFTNRLNRGEDITSALGGSLSRLRGDIERIFRSVRRRTKHAQEHHEQGKRPTRHAMDDLRKAPLDAFLKDTRRDTYVVIGANGRAHIFSETGKHITSLNLGPGELERKRQTSRWVAITTKAAASLRELAAS